MQRFFIISLLFTCYFSKAQTTTWNRSYDFSNSETGHSLIADSTGYTVFLLSKCLSNTFLCSRLIRIDMNGELLWEKAFMDADTVVNISPERNADILPTPSGGYLLCHTNYNIEQQDYDILVIKTDSIGNEEWRSKYGGETVDWNLNAVVHPQGGYLLHCGGYPEDGNPDKTLIKIDEDGNEEWRKDVGFLDYYPWNDRGTISIEDDGSIMTIWTQDTYVTSPTISVARLSPQGDIIWIEEFYETYGCKINDIKQMLDGNYVLSYCALVPTGYPEMSMIAFQKIDTLGNLLVEKRLYNTYLREIHNTTITDNGDILVAGFHLKEFADTDIHQNPWIARLDESLNLLWERNLLSADLQVTTIGPNGGNIYDIEETIDGGIIAVGDIRDTLPNGAGERDVWLVKLNADGCQIPGCTEEDIVLSTDEVNREQGASKEAANFTIAPNPARDYLQIRIDGTERQAGTLLITDATGRTVFSAPTDNRAAQLSIDIEVSGFPDGVYFVTFLQEDGLQRTRRFVKVR